MELTERQIIILVAVRDGQTIQNMADTNGVSLRTIQEELDRLYQAELARKITNEGGHTLMRGRELTKKGKEVLRHYGHATESTVR